MAGGQRELGEELAVVDMKVGSADPGLPDPDPHLAGFRVWCRDLPDRETTRGIVDNGFHAAPSADGRVVIPGRDGTARARFRAGSGRGSSTPGRGRPRSLPGCGRLPAGDQVRQQAAPLRFATQGGGAPLLVHIDGGDEHGPYHYLLPERLDTDDHESVLERGRDEHPDDAAED